VVEIVSFTGTLSDTGKDRETSVGLCDVVDELHNQDCLSDTGTSKETNLSTLDVGGEEIDDLDTRDKHLTARALLGEGGRVGVDGEELCGIDGAALVDGVSNDVQNASERGDTDGDGDGCTEILDGLTTDETVGTVHGNRADDSVTNVLGDLEDELLLVLCALDLEGVEDGGETDV